MNLPRDPRYSFHIDIRCHLCGTLVPSKHCDSCHVHLCEGCVEDHCSDEFKLHIILPFKFREIIPNCRTHYGERIKRICSLCKTPLCAVCLSLLIDIHYEHEKENILDYLERELPPEHQEFVESHLPELAIINSLHDEPRFLSKIKPDYRQIIGMACLSDSALWTAGDGGKTVINLYNMRGDLVKSVQTISGNMPSDIACTGTRDLVYTDYQDRSINLVNATEIRQLIRLKGWKPKGLCSTFSDDLLVAMTKDDGSETKVVRYFGSEEKQTIQFDKGMPLYRSGYYISENRNFDICVSDFLAHAVVVVSAAGEFRFRYTGHPSTDGISRQSFVPYGLTTDSRGQILTADIYNSCIHFIDQDGYFLRYISIDLQSSESCLCVDSRDNLILSETHPCRVKKIQYYK